ncbi:hypothetical protein GCM10010277_77880 [Streptomyces longisporoflavus]|nr:hypothetical protein GCM10010277_77880 [Streptomyces longisporoflavus]
MAAQGLTYKDGLVQAELFEDSGDVGDVGAAAHVAGAARAGAVAALVDGDDPVGGAQGPGEEVPLAGVSGQSVQEDDGRTCTAPVAAGQADAIALHGAFGPGHRGLPPELVVR